MRLSDEKQYSGANKIREKLLLFIDKELLSQKNKNSNYKNFNKSLTFDEYQNYKMTLEEFFIDNSESQNCYHFSLNSSKFPKNENSKNKNSPLFSLLPVKIKKNPKTAKFKYFHSISKRLLHDVTIPEDIQKLLIKKQNMQKVVDGINDKISNQKLNKRKKDEQYLKELSFKLKGKKFLRKNSCLLLNSKLLNNKNDNIKKTKKILKDDNVNKNNNDPVQMISKCSPRRIRTKIKSPIKIKEKNDNENQNQILHCKTFKYLNQI